MLLSLREKAERPDEWVPPEVDPIEDNRKVDEYSIMPEDESTGIVDIFSVHSVSGAGNLRLCYRYCSVVSKMTML